MKLPNVWPMPVGGLAVELVQPVTAIVEVAFHVAVGIVPPFWLWLYWDPALNVSEPARAERPGVRDRAVHDDGPVDASA